MAPQFMHAVTKHIISGASCAAVFLALVSNSLAAANDWPQWRGPLRNGISAETGLLKQWPAGGPPLVWKATGLGEGYSSVSVVGDRVFTMGETKDGCCVLMLDGGTGRILWSTRIGQKDSPGGYAGPRSTPAVDAKVVVALSEQGVLACLDRNTGTQLWRHTLQKELGGNLMSGWGYSESPLIEGKLVICTPGGKNGTLAAFDKNTGDVVWRSRQWTDNAPYCSVIVATVGSIHQFIQVSDASVAGVAAADGRLLWRAPRKGDTAVATTPIYSDGFVYVTSGYGIGCNLFKVTAAGGQFTAQQTYANKVMVNHHGGVIKTGDYVYGYSDGKGWVCQNFQTGAVKWENKEKLGKGSLAFADGHFYLRQEDGKGTVVLIEASPEGFREHGRFAQSNRSGKNSWPHPVVARGKLYLRDQDVLLCYDVKAK